MFVRIYHNNFLNENLLAEVQDSDYLLSVSKGDIITLDNKSYAVDCKKVDLERHKYEGYIDFVSTDSISIIVTDR